MGKAPAFQLYAADFYMDTVGWTATEVGAYFRLLLHEWVNGPLPDNAAALSRIAGVDHKTMGKFWVQSVGKKFAQNAEGAWENTRLERTRQEQENYIKSQRNKAKKRWGKGDAGAMPEDMPNGCSSSSSSNNKYILSSSTEIVSYLNEKTGKNFSPKTKATTSHIKARLNEGRTIDDFKRVIDSKCAKWLTDPKMVDYLRPDTLFGTKFEAYLNELPAKEASW